MTIGKFSDYYDRNGCKKSLELYLKHKPECINKSYQFFKCNWTALFIVCCYQYDDIVRMLINQFEADIEIENTVVIVVE